MEVERPQRFRKFVVMPYPRAALSAAEDVYPESILATMRQGFVVLSRLCPRESVTVQWWPQAEWFGCPDCGSQFNAVGEKRGGPAPRGLDHFRFDVLGDGQLEIHPDSLLEGAPIGTDTTRQQKAGPMFGQ